MAPFHCIILCDRKNLSLHVFTLCIGIFAFKMTTEVICLLFLLSIIINNFFFVDITRHFKILQIVFRPEKLLKANHKPSKMEVLKDTFQQSFKLHIYWWELKKKRKKKRTSAHIFVCTHKHTFHISIYAQASTHTCTYRL